MASSHQDDPILTGTLHLTPFRGHVQDQIIRERLQELASQAEGPRIEVVTRFPAGKEQVKDALNSNPTTDTQSLTIQTLSERALETAHECTEEMQWISAAGENALLVDYAKDFEWESELLSSATKNKTLFQDIRSFVSDAIRYPELGDSSDPVVNDLICFTDDFYEHLIEHDYIPRGAVVRFAVEQLREQGDENVTQSDAMLAVQFAEFTGGERTFLSHLTEETDFEAVARKNASVFRAQFEPGVIQKQTTLKIKSEPTTGVPRNPEAIGEWLAEGGELSLKSNTPVRWFEAETYEEHIRVIGTVIQQLQTEHVDLSEIAVIFRDSNSPIGDAVDILWNMGIPVSSTVSGGFEHNPVIRELYAVVSSLAEFTPETDSPVLEQHLNRLQARLSSFDQVNSSTDYIHNLLETISDSQSLESGLGQWINATQLKHRIGIEDDPLKQRLTFSYVGQLLDLARFFDQHPTTETSWSRLQHAIEFEADYTASEQVAAELESQEIGVTVDTVGSLKGAKFEHVFIAGAVDDEYPAEPNLNRLIPITKADDIDVYPRLLPDDLSVTDRTFVTPNPPTENPVRAYYQSLNRRMLAEASRMGNRGLYFVSFEEAAGRVGKRVHPSRYLSAIHSEIEMIASDSDATEVRIPQHVAVDTVDNWYHKAKVDEESLPEDKKLATEVGSVRTILQNSDEALYEALASRRDWIRGGIGDE